jgi:uncharacterized protein YjeT (DUF2065 family)
MWNDLLNALALLLIIEGVIPFLSPSWLRESLHLLCQFDNGSLRLLGFLNMLSGLFISYSLTVN